jgi:hypothetical protein
MCECIVCMKEKLISKKEWHQATQPLKKKKKLYNIYGFCALLPTPDRLHIAYLSICLSLFLPPGTRQVSPMDSRYDMYRLVGGERSCIMHHFPYGFVQYLFSMQTVIFLHTFPLKYLWSPLLSLPSAFITFPSPPFSPAFPLFCSSLFPLHSSLLLCSPLRSLFSSSRLSRYYVLLSLLLFSSSSLSLSTVLLFFSTPLFSSLFPLFCS